MIKKHIIGKDALEGKYGEVYLDRDGEWEVVTIYSKGGLLARIYLNK